MRGKRLTVEEVKALPLGTKVVVDRTGSGWVEEYLGENIETIEHIETLEGIAVATLDDNDCWDEVCEEEEVIADGYEAEYYEYIEGSTTNEETV